MKIVILGATGQVGTVVYNVVSEMYPQHEVIAAVRNPDAKAKRKVVFEPFKDDWQTLGNVDVLVNCIGIIEPTKEMDFEKAHVGLVKLILQHRAAIGNPRIINLSVLGAEKKLGSAFLETKKKADDLLLSHENTFLVRPSIVCTHNTMIVQKFKMIKRMSRIAFGYLPFPKGFLKTRIQPVMGEDVAAAIGKLCVGVPSQRIYLLTGPEIITIRELISGMDKRIKIIPISQKLFNSFFGIGSRLFPKLLNKEQFTLLQTDNVGDNIETGRLLGRPMLSTRQFWKEELQ